MSQAKMGNKNPSKKKCICLFIWSRDKRNNAV
jgi:hypothetical protein